MKHMLSHDKSSKSARGGGGGGGGGGSGGGSVKGKGKRVTPERAVVATEEEPGEGDDGKRKRGRSERK